MAKVTGFSVVAGPTGSLELVALNDASTLYADISASPYHLPVGNALLTFTGGPHPGTLPAQGASYYGAVPRYYMSGELEFEFESGYDAGDLSVWTPNDPEAGSWAIQRRVPMEEAEDGYWAEAWYSSWPNWYSESGELRIDGRTPPPAPDLTGELQGAFTIEFARWTLSGGPPIDTGERMTVTGTFLAPWWSREQAELAPGLRTTGWLRPGRWIPRALRSDPVTTR
jgi:hypothetical protein